MIRPAQNNTKVVRDLDEFVALFRKTNYRFRFIDLQLETGGTDVDAEFNYKDLSHLTWVHNTFNNYNTYVADDFYSAVFFQKFLGLTVPVTVMSMQLRKNHFFVHNSIFSILLASEIKIEPLANLRVNVKTRYAIGAPRFLLPMAFPFLKWALVRNFHTLMAGDIPMRDRRGEIRNWGFRVRKDSYSFADTLDIRPQNVLPPESDVPTQPVVLPLSQIPTNSIRLIGKSDHLGLQIARRNGTIEIYPRICPHEGACLDHSKLRLQPGILCGWHGRHIAPILKLPVGASDGTYVSEIHRFTIARDELRIETLPTNRRNKDADWTKPAQRVEGPAITN